ncbi:HAD hydrolase family protein [Streptomyces sp. DSM 44915]|uniref:HAD hydrolase family protein n=1 Tax=Streptomyces chisholmiae TaxID=3075540 RepID=A0ABU2JN13_9ACTN|nr:HAD hydrolase family protein [Streptomyces sp. DSM 44915]MDT0266094.1 HAD hydrolase family protein [Streptomyces sp. DSM 44915]
MDQPPPSTAAAARAPAPRSAAPVTGASGRIRCAAFDLDGTLLDHAGKFLPQLPAALGRLRRLGVRPLLVTGRSLATLRPLAAAPVLAELEDDLLLSDGNVWFHRSRGSCHTLRSLPWATLDALARHDATDLVAEVDRELIASSRRAATAFALAYRVPRSHIAVRPAALRTPEGGGDEAARRPDRVLDAVTVFGADLRALPAGALPPHEPHLIRALDGQVLRPHGSCKASALERYLDQRGLTLRATAAFGDAYNDGCLLASSALGVAVRHADEVAVRHSDLQLDQSLDEFLLTFDPALAVAPPRQTAPRQHGTACVGGHAHPGSDSP